MSADVAGHTVRVTRKRLVGGGAPQIEDYYVAEPDPRMAEAVIADAMGSPPGETYEAVSPLTQSSVDALGLARGKAINAELVHRPDRG